MFDIDIKIIAQTPYISYNKPYFFFLGDKTQWAVFLALFQKKIVL